MRKIGIITLGAESDWAGMQLLEAARELANATLLSPTSFSIRIDERPSVWAGIKPADSFDAFILRRFCSEGDVDSQFEVFELLSHCGVLVINSPASLSIAESKAETAFLLREAGLPVPRTVVTHDLATARAAVEEFGVAVLKPVYGSQGIDIERIHAQEGTEVLGRFLESHKVACIQEFIPHGNRDIRAFVVGDEVQAAVYRVAPNGEWKTNVSQGAICEPCTLTPEMSEICVEAACVVGVDYTGVDIVEGPDGPVVLEVNGAPSWHGLPQESGWRLAHAIVRHVIDKAESQQPARLPRLKPQSSL